MLAEVELHAHFSAVVLDHEGGPGFVGYPVAPSELVVRYHQPMAAPPTEPGLERHEHPGRRAGAGVAVAEEELDAGYDAAAQAHVLRQRPFGQCSLEFFPERAVVAVEEPNAAVGCLKLDEGYEGVGCGAGCEKVAANEVEDVVHF